MTRYNYKIEDALFYVEKLWDEGEWSAGLARLEDILYDEPACGKAHAWFAWIAFAKLGDYRLAERHYALALKFEPEYPGVYLNYIAVLMALRKYNQAIEVAILGLSAPAVDRETLYNEMGVAFDALRNYKKAIECFRKAIECTLDKEEKAIYTFNIKLVKEKAGFLESFFW